MFLVYHTHSGMSASIPIEIEKSRRDVLDLSLRNSLLNFHPSKRRGLEVLDELSRELFRILVRNERVMYFLPTRRGQTGPESLTDLPSDVPAELLALLAKPAEDPNTTAARHTDNKLQTALTLTQLNLRLRETFRQARLSIEEQGVNILYLALGMLRWYESDSSSTVRRAPLILIPVRLTQSNVRGNFKLTWTKDEIEPNLSLEAKLKQDFNVHLPEMPSEDELNVDDYLAWVEKAVVRQPRWSVERNEIHLNFFSFSKLLIYKDLDPTSWPEGDHPADHPLVQQLLGSDGFVYQPSEFGEDGHIDGDDGAAGLHPVVDADSSQTLAVLDVMKGRNLVIQGPPGTGKSQTITNMIGEALARGKSVLFVAEKMAALEVVKRRLDSVHLGDACLELHSHKTNKRAVLDELRRALALGRPAMDGGTENRVLLEQSRKRLNDYARAANLPVAKSERTPQELVGRMARLEAEGLTLKDAALPIKGSVSWTWEEFVSRRELIREMQELVGTIGIPSEHLWWTCGRLQFVPTEEHSVREVIGDASTALRHLGQKAEELRKRLCQEVAFSELDSVDLERMIRTARTAAAAPSLSGADHRSPVWLTEAGKMEELAGASLTFAEIRSKRDSVLIREAWDKDVLAERQALIAYGNKWWRFLSGSFREARRRVQGLCRAAAPDTARGQLELMDAILEARRLRHRVGEANDIVASLFPGLVLGDRVETHRAFAEAARWLVQLHRDVAKGRVGEEIHDMLDLLIGPQSGPRSGQFSESIELESSAKACERGMEVLAGTLEALAKEMVIRTDRLEPGKSLEKLPYNHLHTWLETAHDQTPSIHEVVRFNQLERKAEEAGIGEVSAAAASREDAARQLTGLFEHACYSAWLDLAFRDRPTLAEFDGATHAGIVERFRELDMAQFRHNQALIAERHWQQLPRHQGGGQLGVLKREFQKKTRHLPVRVLMKNAGRAIQSIKPVFMMSPLSIAKYIPPGSVDFDLVVFDEASQVRPVEALGAIIRGRQAVVVGDSKQLPPTSFFDKMAYEDEKEGSQTVDLESILGMFCAQGAPERMLRWHYRSRHESLIAVSNHEFYDNRLVVFPSPDASKVETGLLFEHQPEANYERRGINTAEAKMVAQAVMENALRTPHLTLGVAAFSNVQARRIEDEVDILRRRDPSHEAFFAGHPEEPFFVKNLENVQGDERDIILISIGYGKIDGGYLPMNFGPLNRDGGERRLNVLITRARRRCVVYSNFLAADLDLRRSRARGVEALKTFLKYAHTGMIDVPEATGREADSPFEEEVAAKLRTRGHDVDHQVGSAGFFIDLAVRDPSKPGRYVLGIECDGASYHSARSARDRDRLRQQVLEGLGWKIHRIWSTDWFRDSGRELTKVEDAVRSTRMKGVAPPPKLGKPLERGPEPEPEPEPIHPYTLADPNIGPLWEPLHETDLGTLAQWINLVVAVESPVHLDEVTLRIRTAVGIGRAGRRIREQMRDASRVGVNQGLFRSDSHDFLWRPGQKTTEVRRRDGKIHASLRNPLRIPTEEIAAALCYAVRVSYGIGSDEAVKEAIRLFGFKQSGRKIVGRFQQVLDELVADGDLVWEDSLLQVPDTSI